MPFDHTTRRFFTIVIGLAPLSHGPPRARAGCRRFARARDRESGWRFLGPTPPGTPRGRKAPSRPAAGRLAADMSSPALKALPAAVLPAPVVFESPPGSAALPALRSNEVPVLAAASECRRAARRRSPHRNSAPACLLLPAASSRASKQTDTSAPRSAERSLQSISPPDLSWACVG